MQENAKSRRKFAIYVFVNFLLIAVSYASDYAANFKTAELSDILRSILDNFTHGIIAMLSMYAFLTLISVNVSMTNCKLCLYAIQCGLLACIIDIDHFIAAKSFKLKDVLALHERPLFHCTTILLIPGLVCVATAATRLYSRWIHCIGWILVVAVATHHLRDATRRGIWFCPFGATPPISPLQYAALLVIVPLLCFSLDAFVLKTASKWSPNFCDYRIQVSTV